MKWFGLPARSGAEPPDCRKMFRQNLERYGAIQAHVPGLSVLLLWPLVYFPAAPSCMYRPFFLPAPSLVQVLLN